MISLKYLINSPNSIYSLRELDGSGYIISYEEYYPYGSISYQGTGEVREVPKKIYRYTGKERDEENELYYFGARYYSSWLGRDNAPFTIDGIAQMIRNLGKRHGIRLSPHKLRHSFAISFLRNGANPFELQIALGHSTLEMTRRYTQALGFDDVFKRHVIASPVNRLIG